MLKNFKLIVLIVAVLACCLASCERKPLKVVNQSGKQFYRVVIDGDTTYVENGYDIWRPKDGQMPKAVMCEMLRRVFNDTISTSWDEACERYATHIWTAEDEEMAISEPIDSIGDDVEHSYFLLSSACREDSGLFCMTVFEEDYMCGAAHGLYAVDYITYDHGNKRIVELSDLVDTGLMGPVVVRAVEDLVVNKEVNDCLFRRNPTTLPVSTNFFIDSTRSTITLVYGLYEIAPYSCGIQSVVLPIYWLSKHVTLTPYARRLFGMEK